MTTEAPFEAVTDLLLDSIKMEGRAESKWPDGMTEAEALRLIAEGDRQAAEEASA